jgi:RNA polymerase sigma factor (sigma-70 family)
MSDTGSTFHTRPSLLLRLRDAQDGASWQTFVDVYAPLVYRYCRGRGLQDADAADVSQEVLVQVAQSLRTFEYNPERGRFRDWLGTVTRSKITRFREKQGPAAGTGGNETNSTLAEAAAPVADAEWTAEFNAGVLRAALARARPCFEPATWQAFERVWLEHRSADETAHELGLPMDVVYQAKSRVLKRLRQEVLELAEDLPQMVPLG